MKKTVYLHVGSSKTGTSSLQGFLAKNTASLAERGFFVPPHTTDVPGHHELPLSLIKDIYNTWYDAWPNISRKSKVVWDELVEQIDKSEHPNTIISSEIFHDIPNAIYSPHQKKAGELIKNSLHKHNVYVIAYIRPIDDYIKSAYRQYLKNGPLSDSMAQTVQSYKRQHQVHLYPSTWLDFYASLFGKDSLIVRKYDCNAFRNNNIIFDFIDTLGIKYPPEDEEHFFIKENPNIQEDHVSFRRALNTESSSKRSTNIKITNVFTKTASILNEADEFPAEFSTEISSIILNEHATIKERYGIDLGSEIELKPIKAPNRDFPEHLKLGLTGLVINQIGEVERKIDDLARATFNIQLMPHVRKATPALVYPPGAHANWLMQNTILASANIVAWVDRNPDKHGETHFAAPIIAPDDISRYAPGVVFITSPRFGQEIFESLLNTLPASTEIVFLS